MVYDKTGQNINLEIFFSTGSFSKQRKEMINRYGFTFPLLHETNISCPIVPPSLSQPFYIKTLPARTYTTASRMVCLLTRLLPVSDQNHNQQHRNCQEKFSNKKVNYKMTNGRKRVLKPRAQQKRKQT